MIVVGVVYVVGLLICELVCQVSVVQLGIDCIIVKYCVGSVVVGDCLVKLFIVQLVLICVSLVGGIVCVSMLGLQVVCWLGVGVDVICLQGCLVLVELQCVLKELKVDFVVQYVEVDVKLCCSELCVGDVQFVLVLNDLYYQQYQWYLYNVIGGINVLLVWDVLQGEGVVVVVFDIGILLQYLDLVGNLLEGYDFISDVEMLCCVINDCVLGVQDYGDWVENDNECYIGFVVEDSFWYGIYVVGIVVEQINNGVGMVGVVYKVKVLLVCVFGKCGGYFFDIVDVIIWVFGGMVVGVFVNVNLVEVINMSFGGSGSCDGIYQDVINGVILWGIIVVVVVGNEIDNVFKYCLVSCDGVVIVGVICIIGGIIYYFNYGICVDLFGLGGGGSVDGNFGGYVWQFGFDVVIMLELGSYSYMGMGGMLMVLLYVVVVVVLVQSVLIVKGKDLLVFVVMCMLLKEIVCLFLVSILIVILIGIGIVDVKVVLVKVLEELCIENCGLVVMLLINKIVVGGLNGMVGSSCLYSFEVVVGKQFSVIIYGGIGNVLVYIVQGCELSVSDNDGKLICFGMFEMVWVNKLVVGIYYIKVVGEVVYNGVSIFVMQ